MRRIHHHFQKHVVFCHHAASLTSRGTPKPTAVRTQNPAGLRRTCFLAGCDSVYPGGRPARKTVLKLRPCFPPGLHTATPPPATQPHHGPSAASAVIRSHAEGSLEAVLALTLHAALRAASQQRDFRVRGVLCVVCATCVSPSLCAEAGAGPPHTCRGCARVRAAASAGS